MNHVTGKDECIAFLKGLNEQTNRKLLLGSLRDAARPLVKMAKQLAPVAERSVKEFWGKRRIIQPGLIKKSIGTIVPKKKNEQFAELLVGVKRPRNKFKSKGKQSEENKDDPYFRHMVIRGTAGYTIKNGPRRGGFMPGQKANPFIDQAVNLTQSQVESALTGSLEKVINAYVKRTKK
ncbi:MAG: hypothetical protein Q8N05_06380 [Bacteroidota bacterium]|nr:hypothetical protein [Bacteroidota bacterium]